jgi:hypothetical protein
MQVPMVPVEVLIRVELDDLRNNWKRKWRFSHGTITQWL